MEYNTQMKQARVCELMANARGNKRENAKGRKKEEELNQPA
jgi:hypothetical protein